MCDTFASVSASGGGSLFAKNSDRVPSEPQVIEHHPGRRSGGTLATQYIEIPDTGAHAMVLSSPTWLWGAEHGVNEHGLAVGNERVYSSRDLAGPPALIGMDLVRLVLERATSAEQGVDVLVDLLARHGQGGSGEADHDDPYDSSFLLVDGRGGWVVETSGRDWVAAPFADSAAISNRYTLGADWARSSGALSPGESVDQWHLASVDTCLADHRLAATTACSLARPSPAEAVATQRFHGSVPWGAPGRGDQPEAPPSELGDDLSGVTVCMHIPGFQATTAAMICSLPADDGPIRIWACLGSPCCGIYLPFIFSAVPQSLSDLRMVERFAAVRDMVDGDHSQLRAVRAVLDPLEAEIWEQADAINSADHDAWTAFAHANDALLDGALTSVGV